MRRLALLALLIAPSFSWAFSDQDANELILKVLKTSNPLTKAAIGQLLYEGLLQPRPGMLRDIVSEQGGVRAKAAFQYLKLTKNVTENYGHDASNPPAGSTTKFGGKVTVPDDVDPTTVSAYVTGWGLHHGFPPATKLKGDGSVDMATGVQGDGFVAMRGPKVDIAYCGDTTRIMPRHEGRTWTPLEKSRMVIAPGELCVSFLFPFTGTSDWGFPNLVDPKEARLVRKTPGKAKLIWFAENSRALTKSLVDPNQPMGRVEVVGDFNGWKTDANSGTIKELFDDGGMVEEGSTDAVVGDGVYTRTLELPKGTHGYAFLINGSPNLVRDPYEEGNKVVEIKTQLGKFKIRVSTITVE
jgi:hypothetical protein